MTIRCTIAMALLLGLGSVQVPALLKPLYQAEEVQENPSARESGQASSTTQASPESKTQAPAPQTESPESPTAQSPAAAEQPTPPTQQTNKASQSKSTTKRKAKKHTKQTTVPSNPSDGPKKKVVQNGSAPDPELEFVPGVSREQASRQIQYTNQLLSGTDSNLKIISARQSRPGDQDQITKIRSYMSEAKAALNAGDLQRGQTLAYKANLLSKELLGR
jgi:hypothetical protein